MGHLERQIQETNIFSGGAQEERYAVVCVKTDAANIVLEEVEVSRAMFEIYEGGIVCFTNYYNFLHSDIRYNCVLVYASRRSIYRQL